MSSMPFFSVVIPVYNSERFLNSCIESVFKQTCDDFEMILVDDESKDRSAEICEEWKTKYPDKVNVIHQKNTGVYIAKRNGIKASKGQYIYVIDNDDLMISDSVFTKIKRVITKLNCDLVFFNATDNLDTKHLVSNFSFKSGDVFKEEKLKEIYDNFLSTKDLHHIWMMIFKRELYDWEFDYKEKYRMLRDGPSLVLPIISSARRITYIDDILYYWRIQNLNSASKHYDVIGFYNSVQYLHRRILLYAKQWKYKYDDTDKLVSSNYMTDISIVAIKARTISKEDAVNRSAILRMLADDTMFRNEYTFYRLPLFRKIIIFTLYHRYIWLLNAILSFINLIK